MKIAFILAGFFLLLLLLEALFPLRHRTWAVVRRLLVNLCVSALAFTAAAWIVRPIGLSLAAWMSAKSFGLLHIVPMPAVVQFGLALLLMDLTFYYWHLANHMLPVLWRFHNVHHIDPDLDVSTALRFHVGEVLLSAGFRALQVSLIGLPPLTYMIYEGVFQASTLFQHSNIRLPLQVERLLNTVLVPPPHARYPSFCRRRGDQLELLGRFPLVGQAPQELATQCSTIRHHHWHPGLSGASGQHTVERPRPTLPQATGLLALARWQPASARHRHGQRAEDPYAGVRWQG